MTENSDLIINKLQTQIDLLERTNQVLWKNLVDLQVRVTTFFEAQQPPGGMSHLEALKKFSELGL
jgi:hypothetical protein